MALTHLVDASVLKRLRRFPVRAVVETLAQEHRAARASISDLELGYSARTADERDLSMAAVGQFGLVPTDAMHIDRALEVQRLLAERSQRGRDIPDLLVAAAAEIEGLTVLHYDADFDRIAAVTGQAVEWVVPRGSVD